MDPEEHWKVLSAAIMLDGHVRVGMEDNPFIEPGTYARSNADLAEKIVRISRDLGARDRERGRGGGDVRVTGAGRGMSPNGLKANIRWPQRLFQTW
jgi:hypothetical protein